MERLEALERLLSLFLLRKQQGSKPYNLLITSCVSFTSAVCQEIGHSTNWNVFLEYMQRLGAGERMEILAHVLRRYQPLAGYQALARLIKEGYFSTIFLCSPDALLEDHLADAGCRPEVLIVGGHSDQHIVASLENPTPGPRLVKLRGCLKGRISPPTFSYTRVFPPPLGATLQRYLNQNLLVVGSIAYDQDLARLFLSTYANSTYYVLPDPPDSYDEVRRTIEAREQSLDTYMFTGEIGAFDTFFSTLAGRLLEEPTLTISQEATNGPVDRPAPGESKASRADVLLVTVTQVETDAVLALFPSYELLHDEFQTYYNLGSIRGARIFLVCQPAMGAGGGGGSILTIFKGIQDLQPATVIMVGVAFGFDPQKFAIGDILVSEQLQAYEHQRVGSGNQKETIFLPRGPRVSVSPRLLSRFKSNRRGWQGAHVAFGLILSGNKLIDHPGYRDHIRSFAPGALGGEMEGEGLPAATQDHPHRVDWILVKAISDWADGEKDVDERTRQHQAASNAAHFVIYILQQGGFARG